MAYVSRRQRIERALPAHLFRHLIKQIGHSDGGAEAYNAMLDALEVSVRAHLDDMTDQHARKKIVVSLHKIVGRATAHLAGCPSQTVLVAVNELVRLLWAGDHWTPDDIYHAVNDALSAAIYDCDDPQLAKDNAELLDAADPLGREAGRKILDALRAEGYYQPRQQVAA